MSISLLYPSNPLNHRQVDEIYAEEYCYANQAGLDAHCFDIESILQSPIFPRLEEKSSIVYRGYMLNEQSYSELEKRFGDRLVISQRNYLSAHYFPQWYKEIESLTIPSIISSENSAQEDLKKLNGKAFIKDYVKSLKTGKGSIVTGNEDLARAFYDMKHYRGTIEGGIVLRKVINFKPDSEIRFFVVNNTIFSPGELINSDMHALAEKVVKRLAHKELKFYTIDIAKTQEGANMVIEIGDGQVSDYVGWELKDFIKVLNHFVES